jgi:hypothetical protein
MYPDELNGIYKKKQIDEMRAILEKEHGREVSSKEINSALRSIGIFAGNLYKLYVKESEREELLKLSPKGLHLEEGGACIICGNHVKGEKTWYDKHGLKCIYCQKAINEKTLPISIMKDQDKESWYSKSELESYFNLKGADLKKCVKASFLKVRIVLGEGKKINLEVFLIKDNKDVLPPKKLLKSRTVKVENNGKEYYAIEPWFDYFTEKEIKPLSKYGIFECLQYTLSKPIDRQRLLVPVDGINPLFNIKQ